MELFFHLSNILYVFSYLVTDILWLRVLAVLGGLSSLVWALTQPKGMASFIGWALVYNVINLTQIARLWHERRPIKLDDDEQRLYAATFRTLTPREFRRLLGVGQWETAKPGEQLIAQGTKPEHMLVLATGRAAVKVDGREVATLGPGQFAGEMSFLTRAATTAAVEVTEPARFVMWPTRTLERFLDKHPELRSALQLVIGRDLTLKLASVDEGKPCDVPIPS